MTRKLLMTCLAAASVGVAAIGFCQAGTDGASSAETSFTLPDVPRPAIPARSASIVDFGAVSDGNTLCTQAFAEAIASLAKQGGGRVVVPAGVWYTGPIVLTDNIDLHLERNAIIVFSDDTKLYPLVETTFEGLNTWRCQSPISARDAKNVAITGEGVIDGNGDGWRAVKRDKITENHWKRKVRSGGIVSDDGKTWYPSESYRFGATTGADQNVSTWAVTREDFERMHDFLRPVMVSIVGCENVLLEGVTFQNSPCWNIHPALCVNLRVENITVRCPEYAQNGDGIDIESCRNVVLRGSKFDVGDDGICIKSGKDEDGRRRGVPTENVVVEGCTVFRGHGGFVVGSEMSGGVRNVLVRRCNFVSTDVGLRFKSRRGRGGVVENIYVYDTSMSDIATEPLLFDLFYGGKSAVEVLESGSEERAAATVPPVDETTPAFRNIDIRRLNCLGARRAMFFNGIPEMPIEGIRIAQTRIRSTHGGEMRHARKIVLDDVEIVPAQGPALKIADCDETDLRGFKGEIAR